MSKFPEFRSSTEHYTHLFYDVMLKKTEYLLNIVVYLSFDLFFHQQAFLFTHLTVSVKRSATVNTAWNS